MTNWFTASLKKFWGESEETKLKRISDYPDITWGDLTKQEKALFAEWIMELTEAKEMANYHCYRLWNQPPNFWWRHRFMQFALKQLIEGEY